MELETFEFEGRTTEEAIEKACKELNVPREKLDIEVIEPGSAGFFGIVGGKKSKIRVRIKEEESQLLLQNGVFIAKEALRNILKLCSMDNLNIKAERSNGNVLLKIEGEKSGIIIGKGGRTLDALEFLINRIVNKRLENKLQITVDVENYRERKKEYLVRLAINMGKKAKKLKRPVATSPLSPRDRRIIHLTLKDDKELDTKSTGSGHLKKVLIIPKLKNNKKQKK